MKLPLGYYCFKLPKLWEVLLALCFGPSKRFTQITVLFYIRGICICNNVGGQLGPETLRILIYWKPLHFSKHVSKQIKQQQT